MCSAARCVKDNVSAKQKRGAVVVDFDFFGMPLLTQLAEDTYEPGCGRAKKLSEGA